MNIKVVSCKDFSINTESFGKHGNPTCLLISGAGAPARFWSNGFCQKLAAAGYFVIRYDHRDSGLSSAFDYEANPYSIFDLADDAIAILDQYGIAKAHVVGHSMGGFITLDLATRHPDRVLTFTAISAGIGEINQETFAMLLQNKPTGVFANDLAGFMNSWKILNGTMSLDETLAHDYTSDLYFRSKHKVDVALNHIKAQSVMPELIKNLPANTVPGLVIHGEEDPLLGVEAGANLAAMTPHTIFKPIPDMGHMIFDKTIESKIVALLTDFWAQTALK